MLVYAQTTAFAPPVPVADAHMSVLVLADRLLTLAQEAERAGLMDSADLLVRLAHDVFDEETEADLFGEDIETEH